MISHVTRRLRLSLALPFLISASFSPISPPLKAQTAPAADSFLPSPKPSDVSTDWKNLVGIYGKDAKAQLFILERDGNLSVSGPFVGDEHASVAVRWEPTNIMWFPSKNGNSYNVLPDVDANRNVTRLVLLRRPREVSDSSSGQRRYSIIEPFYLMRADAGADPSHFYHVTPVQAVSELREKALKLSPPEEAGPFREPDLVELTTLDPAIHLDIRYASAKNFLSTPIYTQARAFMQRPAAEALVRALHKLQPLGYGLLVHDAYRPWYVTKIFWDATPPEGKIFVANPQEGSKHNRGCAVDLTLYDLSSGQAIEMPGLYDEMSPRSFPNFPGGTSLQRWHRDLLRRAMESEGFTVYEEEWWHFDYKDWKQYGILNVPFEKLRIGQQPAEVSH